MSTRSGIGSGAWVLLVIAAVPVLVFSILLGPDRAVSIAAAAVLSTTVDGLSERQPVHGIPVLDIHIDPAHIDSLNADLPWSGGTYWPAHMHYNSIHHEVRFRYRGALTPSHYLGGKRSFRLAIKKPPQHMPFRRANVMNPKSFNMLNNHMGLWIGGTMGVAVPHDEMVFVRINDRDHGVMELCEQPDGHFERVRGAYHEQVPVLKGDFGPVQGRALGAIRPLWTNAEHWQYVGDADSAETMAQLRELVSIINADPLDIDARRDAIARLVDVDAFLRYIAAMQVVNTSHIDQVHNQVLVNDPRTGRFYPVLWDALLMFPQPDEPLYYIHDALAYWILRVPEWRLQKDRHVHRSLKLLHTDGLFERHWRSTEDRIMPSLLADRNKYGTVSNAPEDVHRYSVLHAWSSSEGMRGSVASYWDRLSGRLAANAVNVVRTDSTLHITATSEAPLRLSWQAEAERTAIRVDDDPVPMEKVAGGHSVVLHRAVEYSGPTADPHGEKHHYRVLPLDVTVLFPDGVPNTLTITNAITDEAVR